MGRTLLLLLFALMADGSAVAAPPASGPEPAYRGGLEALHAGRLDVAEAAALSMLNAEPRQAGARQLLGLVKLKRGDLAGALAEFDRALAIDPAYIPAREERAVTLARLGQAQKARIDLEALKARAVACAKACPPELRSAVSRVEAALVAARPSGAPLKNAAGPATLPVQSATEL